VSHDARLFSIADRVFYLEEGRLTASEPSKAADSSNLANFRRAF